MGTSGALGAGGLAQQARGMFSDQRQEREMRKQEQGLEWEKQKMEW